ncbi:MAG: hypothetical protein AAGU11_05670 [Syntrophobacteraceae bacterium]
MNLKKSSGTEFRSKPSSKQAARVIRYFENAQGGPGADERLLYRLTATGAWASSRPAHLFYFFKKIALSQFKLFLDLGSGNGVATCMASLFTRAAGIESDSELVSQAAAASRELGLGSRTAFIRADFLTQRIRTADCLYIYPDKPVYAIEELLQEWEGTLLIYGPHFPPRTLQLRKRLKCGKESLAIYSGEK